MQSLLAHLHGTTVPTPGNMELEGHLIQWSRAHVLVFHSASGHRSVLDRNRPGTVRLARSLRTVSGGWIGKLVGQSDLKQHWLHVDIESEPGKWVSLCARATHPSLLEGLSEREPQQTPVVEFAALVRALEGLRSVGTALDIGREMPAEITAIQKLRELESKHRNTLSELHRLRSAQARSADKLKTFESRDNSRTIELAKLRAELQITSQELEALRLQPSEITPTVPDGTHPMYAAYNCPKCLAVGHTIEVRFGRWIPTDGDAPMDIALCPLCWRSYSASGG